MNPNLPKEKIIINFCDDFRKLNYKLKSVNLDQTIKNGKIICMEMEPLVENRLRLMNASLIRSSSYISKPSGSQAKNGEEKKILKRIEWKEDSIAQFIQLLDIISAYCSFLEKKELTRKDVRFMRAGSFLNYKFIKGYPEDKIWEILDIKNSNSTQERIKKQGYLMIAILYDEIEYEDMLNISFKLPT